MGSITFESLSYSKLNNYDKAIKNLNLSLLIKPKSPVCYLELGLAFHGKKDFSNAELNYKLAASNKENYLQAFTNLGNYTDIGDFNKADECLKRALKINPNYPVIYNFLDFSRG